jgi:hypothetical protein
MSRKRPDDDPLASMDAPANDPLLVEMFGGTVKPYRHRDRRAKWFACGAYARQTGKPCQAPGNGRGGRCKQHGGMCTGPKTPEGRYRAGQGLRDYWRRKRLEREAMAEASAQG